MWSLTHFFRVGALAATVLLGGAALAQERSAADPDRGPVTNLPMPRYVSLKSAETNVRRGPSLTHRIDWIYKRADLPVQIIAEYERQWIQREIRMAGSRPQPQWCRWKRCGGLGGNR